MTEVTSDKKILINYNINNCKLIKMIHQTKTIWDNCIKKYKTRKIMDAADIELENENNISNILLCPLCRHIGCVNNNCIKLNEEINSAKMRRNSLTPTTTTSAIATTSNYNNNNKNNNINKSNNNNNNNTDDLIKMYNKKIYKNNLNNNNNYNENENCVHHNNKEINQNSGKLCLNKNKNVNTPTNAFKLNKKLFLQNDATPERITTTTVSPSTITTLLLLKNTFTMVIFMSLIIFLNNLTLCNIYVNGDQIKPSTDLATAMESGICQSMDIRNTPSELNILKGCRVVEGFVQILLIEKYNESEYEQFSFPELQEITDYLLLFRVNGLKSLNKLFPNLSVIRGNKLIKNYALIIYEVMNIQEIGLSSLSYIGRGAIRIEKNPMLCYVNSIDWTLIAHNTTQEDHYILGNKKANECPSCPGHGVKSEGSEDKSVTHDCPLSLGDDKRRLCWNRQHCQKICPASCGERACNENGQCCDESCLGGCSGPKLNNCTVCRYFSIGDVNDRRCTKTCPANTFQHMGRRCIHADECKLIGKPLDIEEKREYPYIPFNGVCLVKCPANFFESGEEFNRTCRPCDGLCKKSCKGANIDSISSAQKLRGCTHIAGSLEIQIRSQGGLNIVKELEQSLSMIEEIDGYLKVARSFPLLSLNFLKGLKVIHGRVLESNKYALIVLDNQNIQDLWDENHNVTIERGKLSFHFNPKLCFYKIERLKSMVVEKGDFVNEDVARSSNGDKIACNVTLLNVTVKVSYTFGVILEWEQIQIDDVRNLLGYVVYYIQAPYQNITLYDGRDACGGDGWHVDDINDIPANGSVNHIITHLTPYTQYAFYVKTYTVAAETTGGQSDILYFRTEPGQPENVQKLKSYTNGSSEIVVQWEPPKKHNGNLTTYIIKGSLMKDDSELLRQRNYCQEPLKRVEQQPPIPEIKPSEEPPTATKDDCDCEKFGGYGRVSKIISENDAEQQINFEDTLHNWVYIKRYKENSEPRRRKRNTIVQSNETYALKNDDDTPQIFPTNSKNPDSMATVNSEDILSRKDKDGYFEYIYQVVNATTTMFVLRNVKHYSSYSISVKACRDRISTKKDDDPCGNEAIIHQRTSKMDNADDILVFNVFVENLNQTLGSVRLSWSEPMKPNSLIVTYTIKYQRVDIEHAKFLYICLTQRQFQNLSSSYILSQLDTGNYSVQIMATSLAGDGNYTPPKYFSIDISHSQNKPMFIIIGIICFLIVLVGGFFYWRKKFAKPVPDLKLIASVNPEYVSMQYTPDEWEVPRDKIIQMRELGQGSFGMVYEGVVKNSAKSNAEVPCAIKTVNENATDRERINFLKEASVMKAFDTHHVVQLLGVVSRGQPTLVIMELMKNGDLKGYLRSHRPDAEPLKQGNPPTLKRILQMAIEIADGMSYLSNNKFVHRDLAARNCMVAEDLTVKIGDFGMTRDIYETDYYRKGTKGLLPVRWMSPESLKDGVFTSHSDVFSYGVVLWEMATLASQPYQGLSNDQVLRYVIDGGVMERPENCPDKLYDLMRQCWQHRPSARPTFLQIVENLLNDANPKFREVSYYYSDEGQVNVLAQSPTPIPDDVTTPLRQGDDALSLDVDNYLVNSQNSQHSHTLIAQDEGPIPKIVPAHSPLSGGIGSGIFNDATESEQQQQQTSTSGSGSVLYLNNGNNGSVTSHIGLTGPTNTANYSQMQQSSIPPQQPYKQRNIRHTNRNAAAALAAMAASQAATAAASSATTNENYDSNFIPPGTSNLKDSSGGVIVTIDGDNKEKQLKKSGYYYNDMYIGNQPTPTRVPPISTSDNNRPSTSTASQHNLFPDFLRKMKSKLSYGGNANDSTNGSNSRSNKKSKKSALISKIPILNKSQDEDDDDDEASGVVSGSSGGAGLNILKYKQMKRKSKPNTTSNSGSGNNGGNGNNGGGTGSTDRKKSIPSQTQLMHDKDRLENLLENGGLTNALVSVYDNDNDNDDDDDDDDINIDEEDDYDDGFYDVMHSKKNLNQDAGVDYSYDGGKTASLLPTNLNYKLTPTKTMLGKSVGSSSSVGGVGGSGGGNNSGGSSSIGSDIRIRKHDFLVHNNS